MGCICSSAHPSSPRPSAPPAVEPIIKTKIGNSKGSTLLFKHQDFDRAILPKMDEDKRNTLLQPDGALIVKVRLTLPSERPSVINAPLRFIEWKYVVTKVESDYKFELQENDWRAVARPMDLLEGDEVELVYPCIACEGDDSTPCFSISPEEIQPKPLLKIGGDPKEGIFLFTKEEFERHILPIMTDADQNTLSPDDGTLNVTIKYWGRELPFVLSKVDGHYKFEYVGSEGFARRLDHLREGDPVRLRYLNQAWFSLDNASQTSSIFLPS